MCEQVVSTNDPDDFILSSGWSDSESSQSFAPSFPSYKYHKISDSTH